MGYKCGYVSLVGKANAGKSTLINAIVGEKVAIVSPKPQTTRNNILGIYNGENSQIVFIDTPGIHISKNELDRCMAKNVRTALGGSDVIVYLFDGGKKLLDDEIKYIEGLIQKGGEVIIAVTKIDVLNYEKVYPLLARFTAIKGVKEIIPLSSLKKRNIDVLLSAILKLLPESKEKNFIYADDEYTDKSVKFMVAEIVREKALYLYDKEIPHGIALDVVTFNEKPNITNIDIDIICERDTHKSIIIGNHGEKIKKLGELARLDIEKLLNKKVMLKLFVKVEKDWRQGKLSTLGLDFL